MKCHYCGKTCLVNPSDSYTEDVSETGSLEAQTGSLEAENKKLRGFLNKYGCHIYSCGIWQNDICTCGFEQAWKGKS